METPHPDHTVVTTLESDMTSMFRTLLISMPAAASLVACDAAKNALESEPQTSYCEAVCDWAVECSGETETLDACLEATRAANSNCADAENGDLNPASRALVEDCVATVEADTCDGLTGSVDAQTTATPSAECVASEGTAAADAYNEARISTQSSGETFCEDLGSSICAQAVDCLIGDFGVDEATDALQSACEATAVSELISTCQTVDLDPSYGTDPNVNRMTANTCSSSIEGLSDSCAVFSADAWPAECGAVIVDAEALPGLVGNLISFANSYGVEVP
tara:strand:+ start:322 stop:1158 length:837 start_codon:yes stop_codon:yes gene_type:complete